MTDQGDDDAGAGRTPARGRNAFDCPHCGAFANQHWFALKRTGTNEGRFYDGGDEASGWNVSHCAHCSKYAVWRNVRMIYPTAGTAPVPHPEMPPEAKELYEEAREVVGISRRAGAALARASLERLLKTLDPDAGNVVLAARIERLIPQVPGPLGQMLTVIRVAGNAALHVDDQPDDVMVLVLDPGEAEVVELIFEAINELVDEKVTRPRKVSDLYSRVPESIRERVEKVTKAGAQDA